jgi:hypothetical protein
LELIRLFLSLGTEPLPTKLNNVERGGDIEALGSGKEHSGKADGIENIPRY